MWAYLYGSGSCPPLGRVREASLLVYVEIMRAVVQRVSSARVEVDGVVTGEIGRGLLILLGVSKDDTVADAQWLLDKVKVLRIFADEAGKMNRSVEDIGGGLLIVSQFT